MKTPTTTISPARQSRRVELWNAADTVARTYSWGTIIALIGADGADRADIDPSADLVVDPQGILARIDRDEVVGLNEVLTMLRRAGDDRPRPAIAAEYRRARGLIRAIAREYR